MPTKKPPKTASPIRSTQAQARAYERQLRRDILNPIVRETEQRIREAGLHYAAITDAIDRIPTHPLYVQQRSEAAARAMAARLKAWHIRRFERVMRQALGVPLGPLDDAAIRIAVEDAVRANVDLVRTIPTRYHAALKKELLQLADDAPFDQARMRAILQKGYRSAGYNLRRLTRDQTSKTIGRFNRIRQQQAGIQEYVWSTSGDERVRPTHRANDGLTFSWESPPSTTGHPGEDIQCFPGEVSILPAGLQASVAYRYVGQIVEIRLADGVTVAMTPNHPVLTESGWKRACELYEGEKLLKHSRGGGFSSRVLNPQLGNGYPLAQQLHGLLGGRSHKYGSLARGIDLHGEPAGRDEEIEVVPAPGVLRDEFDALGRQVFPDLGLEPADMGSGGLPDPGGAMTDFHLPAGIPDLFVGGSGELPPFLRRQLGHADQVGVSGVANGEPQVLEATDDHVAADLQCGGDLFDRLLRMPSVADSGVELASAFEVARVAGRRVEYRDCHVYNFQTSTGLILGNGVVTHNCRCVALAVVDGMTPASGAAVSARQPEGGVRFSRAEGDRNHWQVSVFGEGDEKMGAFHWYRHSSAWEPDQGLVDRFGDSIRGHTNINAAKRALRAASAQRGGLPFRRPASRPSPRPAPAERGFRGYRETATAKERQTAKLLSEYSELDVQYWKMTTETAQAVVSKKMRAVAARLEKLGVKANRVKAQEYVRGLGGRIRKQLVEEAGGLDDPEFAQKFRVALRRALKEQRAAGQARAHVYGMQTADDEMAEFVIRQARELPEDWVKAGNQVGPIRVRRLTNADPNRLGDYNTQTRVMRLRDAGDRGTAFHEYVHHIQMARPDLQALFQREHLTRVRGWKRGRLRYYGKLEGRDDKYVDPYAGLERDWAGPWGKEMGPPEVMTVHLEMLFRRRGRKDYLKSLASSDPDMLDLMLGMLFHL